MGIAATLILSSLSYYYLKNGGFNEVTSASIQSEPVPTILEEDPESPIHGVSVAELERRSGMPVGGWTPIFNKSYSTALMREWSRGPAVYQPAR